MLARASREPALSIVTLSFVFVFGCVGAWFGWRYASMAIHTGTAPRWRRPVGVGRRDHARSVRRRRKTWRVVVTLVCFGLGGGAGFVAKMLAPILQIE
jgi:TRAP-type C4-dicarboxylate transport system permease small subunit